MTANKALWCGSTQIVLYPINIKYLTSFSRLQCFKSAWLSIMLHDVYHFPHNSSLHLTTTDQINRHTIQWTLGAILFKTRYLPLREVQRNHELETPQHTKWTAGGIDGLSFALLLLAAITVIVVVFYLRRRTSHRRIVSPHPRFLPQGRVFKFSESHDEKVWRRVDILKRIFCF